MLCIIKTAGVVPHLLGQVNVTTRKPKGTMTWSSTRPDCTSCRRKISPIFHHVQLPH